MPQEKKKNGHRNIKTTALAKEGIQFARVGDASFRVLPKIAGRIPWLTDMQAALAETPVHLCWGTKAYIHCTSL